MDPGRHGSVFLSHALRLPENADRVWAGTEFRNRSGQDAEFGSRSLVAYSAGGSDGDLRFGGRNVGTVRGEQIFRHDTNWWTGFEFSGKAEAGGRSRTFVFRQHSSSSAGNPQFATGGRKARLELLHSLPRPETHNCRAWLGQNRRRRFPYQRGCRIAGGAGGLPWNCDSERATLRLASAEGCGIRAPEGL